MGLIDAGYENATPNVTACNTLNDIRDSHKGQSLDVMVEVTDTYGMLILLGFGLGLSILVGIAEIALKRNGRRKGVGKGRTQKKGRVGWGR